MLFGHITNLHVTFLLLPSFICLFVPYFMLRVPRVIIDNKMYAKVLPSLFFSLPFRILVALALGIIQHNISSRCLDPLKQGIRGEQPSCGRLELVFKMPGRREYSV